MRWFRWGRAREQARIAAEELAAMVRMADEDTTLLGEQLSALGRETDGATMDTRTQDDYQGALDAYEAAKRAVPRLTSAAGIPAVVDTLTTGRYLLACVRAGETAYWQAGEPVLPYGRGWFTEGMIHAQANPVENLGGFSI
jgi:hypothetical protein